MTGRNTETIQLDPPMLVMNASLMTKASGEMSRITGKYPLKKENPARQVAAETQMSDTPDISPHEFIMMFAR